MNFADPAMSLLAASGGDTVKLFDVSMDPGDPCILSHTPSPGSQVNSVKWNHTSKFLLFFSFCWFNLIKRIDVSVFHIMPWLWASKLQKPSWSFKMGLWLDLVVASAGDDKRISLWRKNGQSMGTIPTAGSDSGDNAEVSWSSVRHISFIWFKLPLKFHKTINR